MFQQQPLRFGVMVKDILRKERVLLGTVISIVTNTVGVKFNYSPNPNKLSDHFVGPGEG